MSWNLGVDLLKFRRPSPAVSEFIRNHVASAQPGARFDGNHIDAGTRDRQSRNASSSARADDDDIRLFECGGHSLLPLSHVHVRIYCSINANVQIEPPVGILPAAYRVARMPPSPDAIVTYCFPLCVYVIAVALILEP